MTSASNLFRTRDDNIIICFAFRPKPKEQKESLNSINELYCKYILIVDYYIVRLEQFAGDLKIKSIVYTPEIFRTSASNLFRTLV